MGYSGSIWIDGNEIFSEGKHNTTYILRYAKSYLKYAWYDITLENIEKTRESLIMIYESQPLGKQESLIRDCLTLISELTNVCMNRKLWKNDILDNSYVESTEYNFKVKYSNNELLNISSTRLNQLYHFSNYLKFKDLKDNFYGNNLSRKYLLSMIDELRSIYKSSIKEIELIFKNFDDIKNYLKEFEDKINNGEIVSFRINPLDNNEIEIKYKNENKIFTVKFDSIFLNLYGKEGFDGFSAYVEINSKNKLLRFINCFQYLRDRNADLEQKFIDFYNSISNSNNFNIKISAGY